ncbi:hypothetical protein [Lactococcus lactis]|jgi:hypothetical protein|uniref:Lipoprotein n=2 Tax=Lactococcus lactis TaxID=1358 RepID=A0AAP8JD39_9LACT|nr:hypothetical protein [Lactococcus lactis]KSU13067.1 hypothetical protein LMG8526_0452 [Lactococcus lactis subsp. lactis]MCQ4971706.1 hypothetical protein [Lactococcus lactis]MCQ4997726.1 hypothetical protein [Lactococcus lactis]MCT3131822.1 hypothetical protein [Lactococcus lactis]MCU5753205.1 hypothetical protein [Lactococcus lactis]
MKKKTWMSLGIVALAVITLSACSTKNSDEAKKTFISDTVALNNSKDYNAQKVKVDVNEFKIHGDGDNSEFNKIFNKGARLDFNIGLDKTNQLAVIDGKLSLAKNDYDLGLMMSQKGIYISSSDIKSLYDNNKAMIPSSAGGVVTIYGAMIDSLDKSYLLIDSQTLDSNVQSSKNNWESTLKQLFESNSKISKADLEKQYKEIPNSDFTKSGDKITVNFSGKDIELKDLINNLSATYSIPKEQKEQLIKESKNIDISKLSVKLAVDKKSHEMTGKLTGSISNTKEKTSADLDISLASTRSKLKETLKEPAATDTNTLEEVQNAAIEKLMTQASAA